MPDHVGPSAGRTIEQDFWEFHVANPQVYETLLRLTREWVRARGRRPLGMKMLFEVVRWEMAMRTGGDPAGDFKLNNNYTALYARLLMRNHPDELAGVFRTRRLRREGR